jgi:hypothetical protein
MKSSQRKKRSETIDFLIVERGANGLPVDLESFAFLADDEKDF